MVIQKLKNEVYFQQFSWHPIWDSIPTIANCIVLNTPNVKLQLANQK